jgi:hypothetical protein
MKKSVKESFNKTKEITQELFGSGIFATKGDDWLVTKTIRGTTYKINIVPQRDGTFGVTVNPKIIPELDSLFKDFCENNQLCFYVVSLAKEEPDWEAMEELAEISEIPDTIVINATLFRDNKSGYYYQAGTSAYKKNTVWRRSLNKPEDDGSVKLIWDEWQTVNEDAA